MSTNTVRETRTHLHEMSVDIAMLTNFFPNGQTEDADGMSEETRATCTDKLQQAEKLLDEVRAILFQVQK